MTGQTYYKKTSSESLDQRFNLNLSFIEMHFILQALSNYQLSSKFYDQKISQGHRDGVDELHSALVDLYCVNEIEIVDNG